MQKHVEIRTYTHSNDVKSEDTVFNANLNALRHDVTMHEDTPFGVELEKAAGEHSAVPDDVLARSSFLPEIDLFVTMHTCDTKGWHDENRRWII